MIVELTEAERVVVRTRYSVGEAETLAWRAFGKAIGVQVQDPMMVMDGDGSIFEPITRRDFYLEEAEGNRYLSLGQFGCWDGGAMRSLYPGTIYISYNAHPDWSSVTFHGYFRPKEASRIIPRDPGSPVPFMTKDGLSSMTVLICIMKKIITHRSGDH